MRKKNEPIRIAQIIGKWVGGGVEAVVMNYYRHIDHSKIQFDFICDDDSTNIPYEEIEKLGGKVILIPPYQKVLKYHKELKKVLKEGNYKIVHSHINTLSVFSLWAAKSAGVPVRIAHNHATTSKKEFKRNIIKILLRPLNKIFATNYMCCSEYAGRWMFGDRLYDNGEVYLLNNAIDLDKFSYNLSIRNKIRKKYKISNKQIIIGHVGRMMETKNHAFLIKIFEQILKNKDAVLMLAGNGILKEQLETIVHEKKIDDRVIFLGQVDNIYDYYNAFDLLILPSLYEGFGMVTIEAQSSNLPCLVSTGVPSSTKINNNYAFLSLEVNEKKWADEAIRLLEFEKREDRTNIISKKGFDIKKEVIKLENKYLSLIGVDDYAKN